jgi:Txe/YoeB family toxin of Txe-Axe toxin-antitoxin module
VRELLHLSMPKWAEEFAGIGKPEPLRHMFAGAWSRRITEESIAWSTSWIATTS